MKKSVDILGLPVISITEGRELGMSKTLLIDAPNRIVAAITIEDEDWYRGVKLIPYDNVIAVGDDAVTINNSENILTLDAAGDFETLLDDNIRVIGTKAITRTGVIQGVISEIYIGKDGSIEKCEITAPEGATSEGIAQGQGHEEAAKACTGGVGAEEVARELLRTAHHSCAIAGNAHFAVHAAIGEVGAEREIDAPTGAIDRIGAKT